jgi:short-subunit dehydrogenase
LNVGSTAGFVPGPRMAGYYASKAYVNSFTEALAVENRDSGVDVTLLAPGPVDTEFQERADMADSVIGSVYMSDPERVAAAGYRGLMAGDTIVVPGSLMKLAYYGSRVTPRPLLRWIVARANGDR